MTQLLALWKGIQEKKGGNERRERKRRRRKPRKQKKVPVYSARQNKGKPHRTQTKESRIIQKLGDLHVMSNNQSARAIFNMNSI